MKKVTTAAKKTAKKTVAKKAAPKKQPISAARAEKLANAAARRAELKLKAKRAKLLALIRKAQDDLRDHLESGRKAWEIGDIILLTQKELVAIEPIMEEIAGCQQGIESLSVVLAKSRKLLWASIRRMHPDVMGWEMSLDFDKKQIRIIGPKVERQSV